MRVLFITNSTTIGGAASSLKEMLKQLHVRHGVECILVINQKQAEVSAELKGICLDVVGVESGMAMESPSINAIRTIARLMRSLLRRRKNKRACEIIEDQVDMSKIDLIHTNSARTDLGMMLGERNQIKCVTHLREFGKEDFNCVNLRWSYIKYMNRTNVAFIAISDAVKKAWAEKGLALNKIYTIYNGIDNTDIKQTIPFKSSLVKCVIVGGVVEGKGQIEIVEALAKLPETIRQRIHVDVVGWGDRNYMDKMKRLSEKLGVNDKISFLGRRDDVHSLLADYDIGLMCSRAEAFGRVTAEYMHAGLFVIAANTGANLELIDDGVTGLLYEQGKSADLADKIVVVCNGAEKATIMAKQGQQVAMEKFTSEINADNVYKLYQEIV